MSIGWKLDIIEIMITMIETIINSLVETDVFRRISCMRPNEKCNSAMFIKYRLITLIILPMIALIKPSKNPSVTNNHKIFDGNVPIAEMVPISLTRSKTDIIITFRILISTIDISTILTM
ncbi:hypothetical protein ES705_50301 [subsurface metagenome]